MKLIMVSCSAMLAIASATTAFAQDSSYPDMGAVAKTGPAPKKEAPANEEAAGQKGAVGTAVETITAPLKAIAEPPSMKKEDSSPTERK